MKNRLPVFGALGIPALLAGCSGPLSTLDPAGPAAQSAAWLWWGMFAFATVVMVVLVALWVYAIKRPPREHADGEARKIHQRWLIGGGLALPIASITLLLAFGIPAGHRMLPLPPADGGEVLRIDVTAHQWWWQVVYPDAGIELRNEVHIPVNTPVDVHIRSEDVIHSFWVPRLAGKLDAIPGRTNVLRLEASQEDTYQGVCAEFCGVGHAHMPFTVTAHAPEAFNQWLEDQTRDD